MLRINHMNKISNFKLMKLVDGTLMNKEVIENSIANKVFDNAPIILIDLQTTYDILKKEQVIGFVTPDTVKIDDGYVVADVILFNDINNKTCYDNWMIRINDDHSCYLSYSCELYSEFTT